jgi:hypothetical protein
VQQYSANAVKHAAAEAQHVAEVMRELADQNFPLIPQEVRPRILGAIAELHELATR